MYGMQARGDYEKSGRELHPGPMAHSAIGIEDGARVSGSGLVGLGAAAGVGAIWIEDGAGFGPEDGEEAPDLGEEARGGRRALCRRADGFPLRLSSRERREEQQNEGNQGEGGAEETRGQSKHVTSGGPRSSGHHGWRGRASRRKGAAERIEAGEWVVRVCRLLLDGMPFSLPGKSWAGWAVDTDSPALRRAGACARRRICPSGRRWCVKV